MIEILRKMSRINSRMCKTRITFKSYPQFIMSDCLWLTCNHIAIRDVIMWYFKNIVLSIPLPCTNYIMQWRNVLWKSDIIYEIMWLYKTIILCLNNTKDFFVKCRRLNLIFTMFTSYISLDILNTWQLHRQYMIS